MCLVEDSTYKETVKAETLDGTHRILVIEQEGCPDVFAIEGDPQHTSVPQINRVVMTDSELSELCEDWLTMNGLESVEVSK